MQAYHEVVISSKANAKQSVYVFSGHVVVVKSNESIFLSTAVYVLLLTLPWVLHEISSHHLSLRANPDEKKKQNTVAEGDSDRKL